MGSSLTIPTDTMQCMGAWRADPTGEPRGGIVVIQEIYGLNAHIRGVVDRYAALGYTAIAPAIFDYAESGAELEYDAAGTAHGRALAAEVGFERAVAAVASAANAIASAGRIGVVGYCWGGSVAFLAATRLGLPAVSYYGARSVPFLHEKAQAPLLFHFGERDSLIPPQDIAAHREAQPQAEFHVYPASHAFNREVGENYEPASAALALQRSLAFFARHLATPTAGAA
ncbi:MAG: dienelactone hydrolase family protein [Tahibacter sp.]